MVAHFSTLKSICQIFDQCTSLLRSSCRVILSDVLFIVLYSTQSSANRRIFDVMLSAISFMQIRNSVGPKTVPCGTPDVTDAISDVALSTKNDTESKNQRNISFIRHSCK